MTSEVVNEVLNAAQEVAPNAPVVEAAVAAVSTVADPSPANLLADVELAYKLIQQFKADIAGLHPTVGNILKALF